MAREVSIFNAGPSVLPQVVIDNTAAAINNFAGTGMSLMEISHRSKAFDDLINDAIARMRRVMGIPENYKVLFLQGGASTQFAMVAQNLLGEGQVADYVDTGEWSSKAIKEARRVGQVHLAGSSKDDSYTKIPDELELTPDAAYCHITSNNTIYGTQWQEFPETGNVPLVADMSSDIMSREIDVTKFGIIYAGAQKNMGPAGVTVVIIRDDLIGLAPENTFSMLNYKTHADTNSMFNTCPVVPIFVVSEVLKWIETAGGVSEIAKINDQKAALIYDILDSSDFYSGTVDPASRSKMNIPFRLPSPELEKKFVTEAEARKLEGLKGHRSVGGIRASIYNAIPYENVERLVSFMKEFEKANS